MGRLRAGLLTVGLLASCTKSNPVWQRVEASESGTDSTTLSPSSPSSTSDEAETRTHDSASTTSTEPDTSGDATSTPVNTESESEPLDEDLVLWLDFEVDAREESGILDRSPYETFFECSVDSCPSLVEGPPGHGAAARFDGVADVLQTPDAPQFRLEDQMTLAVWLRAARPPTGSLIFGKPVGGEMANSYEIYLQPGLLNFKLTEATPEGDPPNNFIVNATYPPPDDDDSPEWIHIAVTWDGESLTLYIDGELAAQGTDEVSIWYDESPVTIGADINNGELVRFLSGEMDELRLYRRALSRAEIEDLAR